MTAGESPLPLAYTRLPDVARSIVHTQDSNGVCFSMHELSWASACFSIAVLALLTSPIFMLTAVRIQDDPVEPGVAAIGVAGCIATLLMMTHYVQRARFPTVLRANTDGLRVIRLKWFRRSITFVPVWDVRAIRVGSRGWSVVLRRKGRLLICHHGGFASALFDGADYAELSLIRNELLDAMGAGEAQRAFSADRLPPTLPGNA